jgi:integrase/recombinase XerD
LLFPVKPFKTGGTIMLNQLIKRTYYLRKHLEAPLLKERQDYLNYWADRGRSAPTLKSIANYILRIVEFLHLEISGVITLDVVEKAATVWAEYKYNHPMKQTFSKTGRERFIWYSVHWLKRLDRLAPLPEEKVPLFNQLFERHHALRRHISAPLLQERVLYLQYWADNGARDCTLRRIAQYLLVIMDYLHFFSLRTIPMKEIEHAAELWARNEAVHRRVSNYSKLAKARFINDAIHWLEMLGCFKKQVEQSFPFHEQLDKYLYYMLHEQGLSKNTTYTRFFLLKDFLTNIHKKRKTLETISPRTIDEVLTKKYDADGYSRRTIQTYASVVRSFLKYTEDQGWCRKGVAESVKAPRIYSYESLPSSPDWDDIIKLLANSQTNLPTDIRDYSILLLLSVYGIRCSEVTGLRLEDIDWKNERLYLRRAKRSKPQIFPLSRIIGDAILRYIKEIRPNNCRLREVFICRRSPYRSLSTSAVYQIVNRRLKPLDLKINHHGPHALRHGCATHLINEGFSLKEISDHLGHQGLETTRIYAKVDLVSLRKVAEMEWEDLL